MILFKKIFKLILPSVLPLQGKSHQDHRDLKPDFLNTPIRVKAVSKHPGLSRSTTPATAIIKAGIEVNH